MSGSENEPFCHCRDCKRWGPGGYVPPEPALRPGEVIDPTRAGRELRQARRVQQLHDYAQQGLAAREALVSEPNARALLAPNSYR
jgi:hypothetical protein